MQPLQINDGHLNFKTFPDFQEFICYNNNSDVTHSFKQKLNICVGESVFHCALS